jgi:flagellar basal body-associated protein FliL
VGFLTPQDHFTGGCELSVLAISLLIGNIVLIVMVVGIFFLIYSRKKQAQLDVAQQEVPMRLSTLSLDPSLCV